MGYIAVMVIAAAVFGLCYLADKGFTRLFRAQAQYRSGLSVRLNKHYATAGLILFLLGLTALFMGINSKEGWLLPVGGGIVIFMGVCLVVYYMTFGIFYDEKGFVLTTFGKPSVIYTYKDIQAQQLYNNQGNVLIELHLSDATAVQLQSSMVGVYPFLDFAFARWCRENGRAVEDCAFHDPANSCWFPPVEG